MRSHGLNGVRSSKYHLHPEGGFPAYYPGGDVFLRDTPKHWIQSPFVEPSSIEYFQHGFVDMKISAPRALALSVAVGHALAAVTQGVSDNIYNRLVEMATISQAAYADLCKIPATITTVEKIYNAQTDINGWVLRDDSRQEIIVVFRGTAGDTNLKLDTNYTLAPFDTLPKCIGCAVHGGYYLGWTSVQDQVESLVQQQASQYPDYGLTVTGHRYEGSPT
jgi:hypothetical protein